MFSLTDPSFWLQGLLFVPIVVLCLYIPGAAVIRSFRLPPIISIPLSIVVGLVLFAFQGMLFGYLGVRWLSYVYLFAMVCWFVIGHFYKKTPTETVGDAPMLSLDWVVVAIAAVGSLVQLSIIWFTGILHDGAAYFCCGNMNDNMWFTAVSAELVKRFPPNHPGLYGVTLQNYHYWSNLAVAEITRLFGISYFSVLFQYAPILLVIVNALLLLSFVRINGLSKTYGRWLFFFMYFGSDIVWVLVALRGTEKFFSMSGIEDGAGYLANMPRAYATTIFLAVLILLSLWIKKRSVKLGVITAGMLGCLVGFKVYAAFFAFFGLGAVALYHIIWKKDWSTMWLLVGSLFVALGVYLPVNSGAGGIYWTGMWRYREFIVQTGLKLDRLEMARTIYANDGKWMKAGMYDALFFVAYMITIFGTKLLGFFQTRRSLRTFPIELNIFFAAGIGASLFLGCFFQQSSGGANTFNFLVYVFTLLSFHAALAMEDASVRFSKPVYAVCVVFVVILTVPRIIYNASNVWTGLQVRTTEYAAPMMDAIRYVRENTPTDAVFLADRDEYYYDRIGPEFSALMGRDTWYSGEELDHFKLRRSELDFRWKQVRFILNDKTDWRLPFVLERTPVSYIIAPIDRKFNDSISHIYLTPVFANKKVRILKVRRELFPSVLVPSIEAHAFDVIK
jgi:hypothetical protein